MTADTSLMPANTSTTRARGRRASRALRCAALALAALAAAALAPASAGAAPAVYSGSSANGGRVFFMTTEKLVPGDTDNRRDVYERSFDSAVGTYVTREVSTGPTGGNDAFDATYEGSSTDGTKVFFSTDESLVPQDTDRSSDVYMRDLTTNTTTLVSQGADSCAPGCGNGPSDAGFAGASADGTEAFFVTAERLVPGDTDNAVDVYMRDLPNGPTTLVSAGGSPCPPGCGNNDNFNAVLRGVSPDGTRAFFSTSEQLSNSDTDTATDIYMRDLPNGPTTLVSQGDPSCAPCGNSNSSPAVFVGSSTNGSKVFFETDEGLVAGDTDNSNDVYQRAGGATTLVSDGTQPGFPANFMAASADGAHVFFVTAESLVAGDTNNAVDVYEWSGGAPSLVTSGTCTQGAGAGCGSSFDAATADGTKLLFTTAESLVGADTDTFQDVYMRDLTAGTTTLESTSPTAGNGAFDASFAGASSDGSHVFFKTAEPMVAQDTDSSPDIYGRAGGATNLITAGQWPLTGNGAFDPNLTGVSGDGAHAFFITNERLTVDDLDTETDVYDYSAVGTPGTLLVSTGNSVVLGPPTPSLTGTNPASPGSSTTPAILGQADQNTSIKIYATPDCSGAPAATGSSAQLATTGIGVTVAAGSTTTFHATATDGNGDTSACSTDTANYQQVAGADGGGGGGGTGGGGGSDSARAGSYVAPQTRITFAPASKTRIRRPVFRFIDATGQAGTTFLCKVDSRAWQSCGSPTRLKRLRRGKHTFQVVGTNAAGAQEPAAVTRSFKVVRG